MCVVVADGHWFICFMFECKVSETGRYEDCVLVFASNNFLEEPETLNGNGSSNGWQTKQCVSPALTLILN